MAPLPGASWSASCHRARSLVDPSPCTESWTRGSPTAIRGKSGTTSPRWALLGASLGFPATEPWRTGCLYRGRASMQFSPLPCHPELRLHRVTPALQPRLQLRICGRGLPVTLRRREGRPRASPIDHFRRHPQLRNATPAPAITACPSLPPPPHSPRPRWPPSPSPSRAPASACPPPRSSRPSSCGGGSS